MQKIILNFLMILNVFFCFASCNEKDQNKSDAKEISEISILEDPTANVSINQETKEITVKINAENIDFQFITPNVKFSDKARLNPTSGTIQNFLNGKKVSYTVYAENGTSQVYTVSVRLKDSEEKDLISLEFKDIFKTGKIEANKVSFLVPFGTDLTKIVPTGKISEGAKIQPELGKQIDFSVPVKFTITAENNSTKEYLVEVKTSNQEEIIRAVWIPDPTHTDVMKTEGNIKNLVNLLDELNLNTIYVATWVRNQTAYNSDVLLRNSTYRTKSEGNFFSSYNYVSSTNDPLKDLISEAHKKGIKVIFWFEYGFMANNGTAATVQNNKVFEKNPSWIGLNNQKQASNYNNSDFYYNAYNPEVQQFLLDLITESLTLYPEVDGIQGDDRMPAMPRNSGYDDFTVNLYKKENQGNNPPQDFNNVQFVNWRLNILNKFAEKLYKTIKAKKSTALVCSSPNPYPWSEQNLMQQWPNWLKNNWIDILSIQIYRNTIPAYKSTLTEAFSYVNSNTTKSILNPGIILKNGSNIMNQDLLIQQLEENRNQKTNGESFFYVDGLFNENVKKVLKAYYPGKAIFPIK